MIYSIFTPGSTIYDKRLKFECTQISNKLKYSSDSIKPGDVLYINGTGLICQNLKIHQTNITPPAYIDDSYREDRLVVFGKHPSADPEGATVDDISLVIYCSNNSCFAIGCLTKHSNIKSPMSLI